MAETDAPGGKIGRQAKDDRIEEDEMLGLLARLVEKSLVVYEEDENGQGRYRLLETVRDYGCGLLLERNEADAWRTQHRDFYLALAEEAKTRLLGSEQAAWLDTLETEHENLRAALTYSGESRVESRESADLPRDSRLSTLDSGLRLAAALQHFWMVRGHLSEGRDHLAAVLSENAGQEPTKALADALNGAGVLAYMQGDFEQARPYFERSLALKRVLGDKQDIALAIGNLGGVAYAQGDLDMARAYQEESLAIQRELGDQRGIASSLNNLGNALKNQGDYVEARRFYEEALEINRETGNREWEANNLSNLGILAMLQGDYETARRYHNESLSLRRGLGDRLGIAYSLTILADLAQAQEQAERAARLFAAADALRGSLGAPLPPEDRDKVDRALTALRAALGEEPFSAAYRNGRALSWEQAVEEALSL